MRNRLDLAALDQSDHRRAIGEEEFHLPGHHVVEREAAAAKGTWLILMPVWCRNISNDRCWSVPLPDDAMSTPSAAALARAMTSVTVFTGTDGVTTRMFGTSEMRATGSKSLL